MGQITFSKAEKCNAKDIAELYYKAYEGKYPLKEYLSEEGIAEMIERNDRLFIIAKDEQDIIGCAGSEISWWNWMAEIGRTVVDKKYFKNNIGTQLVDAVADEAFNQGVDFIWGTCRNYPIYRVGVTVGMKPVGYLETHRVKTRETHMMVMKISERMKKMRVAAKNCELYNNYFVNRILKDLELENKEDEYIDNIIIPQSDTGFKEINIEFKTHEGDDSCFIENIYPFDAFMRGHIQTIVLADKKREIDFLRNFGFNINAFLPGWFRKDNKRYDCIMMSNTHDVVKIPDPKIEDILNEIKDSLAIL